MPTENSNIESDKELAQEIRGYFRRTPEEDWPPCLKCPDTKLARCVNSEFDCYKYKMYVKSGKKQK